MKQRILTILTLLLCFAFTSVNAQDNYDATTMGVKVVEMETAAWGQNKPYNNLCPTVGTTPTKTGCGPTAFAILCHYYKWPECGSGSVTHNGETLDLSTHYYDYENMLLSYSGTYTDKQATAVATLMRDLGYATKVGYGTSATTFSESIAALKSYFSFNNDLFKAPSVGQNSLYRSEVEKNDPDGFKRQLKECLSQGYPVLFSSISYNPEKDTENGRHIFIVDGYTQNDYFHFNFGWEGYGNGWYNLDNVRPDNTSDYSREQRAYLYVIPSRTPRTVAVSASPAEAGTVTVNGNTNSAEVTEGTYATLVAAANSGYAFSHWSKGGAQVSTEKTYKALVAADGNVYVANFLTVGNNRVNVSVTYNSSYGTVTYNSSAVSGTGITPYQNSEVTLVATPLDGYVFNGWTVTKGTDSTNYTGTELTFVATGDMSVEANFSTAIATYSISEATGTLENSTSSRYTTWSSSEVSGLCLTASYNSNAVEAISFFSSQVKLISAVSVEENYSYVFKNPVTYTLSAPEGYVITGYSMTYKSSSANYAMTIANEQMSQTLANSNEVLTLSATGLSAQNTSFTVSGANTNYAIQVQEFSVTIAKEGANVGGGSTPTPDPEPEPDPTPVTYAITTVANPVAGGTAKFAVGTGSQKTQGDVENGTQITLYATANTGYNFVNWTLGGNVVSTDATYNVSVAQAANYVANFEVNETPAPTPAEYPTPTGATYQNNYLTSVTTTGAKENISYTANAHPGAKLVTLPGTVRVEQGKSFTLNLVAKSLSSSTSSVYEDMRYCHASLFTDFDGDRAFGAAAQTWGSKKPSNNIAGNYSSVMNITHEITVPADAPLGTSHVRMIYTNAWTEWPTNGTAELDKGIVYDIVVEVVEPSNEKTLNVTFGELWSAGDASQIVTKDSPAITITEVNGANKIGYSTRNGVKHPFLLKGGQFTISVPAPYKIASYTLQAEYVSFNAGTVEYTNGRESTATATVSNGTPATLSATGLNNKIIIKLGNAQAATAGLIIRALEITYVEEEITPLPFKAEIEGWRNDNPNTHLGTITIGGTPLKLTPEHLTASELTMAEGTTLAFTRKYRGFEFNGFYIGSTSLGQNPTLTAENVAAIDENNPLIAKFTATNTGEATLFSAEDKFSYRIPAIVKTVKDDKHKLIAISDYRHSFDDIGRDNHKTGTTQVDLVMRTSEDNGATWTAKQTIAEGSQHFGYGDAAAVANGQDVLVMAVAGNVFYAYADSDNPQQAYRIYSNDNGVTWEKEDISSNMESLFPNYYGLFFGSGKLAVDPNFNDSGKARVYGAVLTRGANKNGNYVLYSDDWGKTWNILGNAVAANQNEPKVEILPNGQILLSARRDGGRTFNVFTYTNKATSEGSWDTAANGCANGGNGTNGEIILLDAKKPNGTPTRILLQSQPNGSDRRNVSIWYKELSGDNFTASGIASDWTMGKQVSTQLSAYSAMALQENGEIALFFEEAPCYGDDHTKGYSMVYVPLTIEEITGENFLNPNAVVETVTVDVTLTDAQGNTYTHQFDYLPGDAAAIDAALMSAYPFITELGEGNLQGSGTAYTYTNTVTLPFKVSNTNTTVWHNIYWPANTRENDYPVYLSASSKDDTYVPKVTDSYAYGNHPTYNTLDGNEKISWAIYNVNNGFEFIFKNKVTDKYIQVTSVADNHAQNVVYVENIENATAFTIFNKPAGNDYYTSAQYALTAKVGETTGYLCSTSATGYNYATHYFNNSNNGYGHQGAWIEFVEAPDYQAIYDKLIADINNFGAGDDKYTENDDINDIDTVALRTMLFSDLTAQATAVQTVKDSYTEITLTVPAVNDVVPGSVKILDEPVSHKFVPKGEITIQAVPAAGYRFVNWTRPAAEPQASAAARTVAARNSEFVSDQNPYTVTVSEALSLEANFEEIVVTAILKDERENTYNVTLNAFAGEINKANVEAKLLEKYPYIEFGNEALFNATTNTYSNRIVLPFKVSNLNDDEEGNNNLWHNIYYPTNTSARPNYLAAAAENAEFVSKVNDGTCEYGANPTYNTMDGNPSISWAIYNVNETFEFIFKNELTGKYIKVRDVADKDAQNVQFVDQAEATAFTLLKKTGTYNGDYALVAKVGETTGYLCSTSSTYDWATCFERDSHQGAWLKFAEANYDELVNTIGQMLFYFGAGNYRYMQTPDIQAINEDFGTYEKPTYGTILLNDLKASLETIEDAINNWPMISLTINPAEGGTTNINGEENVVHKYVPNGYALPLVAVPAEGYHFVKWIDGTNEVETAAYTKNISGEKDDVIALTAEFAINIYTVNVSTNGTGGSASASAATVEHGGEVTLTAVANDGYEFAGWYNGEEFVSAEANYTFTVTSDINYTARFNEVAAGTVAIHITVASTDGTTVTNTKDGNVKAIIGGIGLEWATDADFVADANVALSATSDHNDLAYLFDGWYKNGVLVSNEKDIVVKATETATYEARFFRGCVVTGNSDNIRFGRVMGITLADGTSIGYDAASRAVVKAGTTVKINTINIMYGYEVGSWIDANDEVVGTDNTLVVEVNNDVTYTAIFEPASYDLTVRANDDSYGTVSATSGTSTGTAIKVGHNMGATITATAKPGYRFVKWTKGTEVVSYYATYTIDGIADVENMVDVEYVAEFEVKENAPAGKYYRFAYEFPAAAQSVATRAVGDETMYEITPANGTPKPVYGDISQWTFTKDGYPAGLILKATLGGALVKSIWIDGDYLDVATGGYPQAGGSQVNNVTYTLSVQNDNYRIVGYDIECKTDGTVTFIPKSVNLTNSYDVYGERFEPVTEKTFSFESTKVTKLTVKSFIVYIKEVGGGETPEPDTETVRYYIQSTPVSETNNAMVMTEADDAASIFYYAGNKLMSYANGKFVKEEGTACGLQTYGAENAGVVTITENGDGTATIAAPSYLHADGTSGNYYVNHCSSNDGTNAHDVHNFIIEEVTSLPVTISSVGYATFYAPVAVKVPADVTAYYLADGGIKKGTDINYASMTPIEGGVIPEYTGVVLEGPEGTHNFNITEYTGEDIVSLLDGTVAAEYVKEEAYVLSAKNGIGFYKALMKDITSGTDTYEAFLNNSHKSYLPASVVNEVLSQGSNGFRLVFGTTAIEEVEAESEVEGIYDLSGRKLEGIYSPGVYIVNGKKVLVK